MRKADVTYKDSGETIFPPYEIQHFNLDFHDEADSVDTLVPRLKRKGIETIIVLLHCVARSTAASTTTRGCRRSGSTGARLVVPSKPPARSNPFRAGVRSVRRCGRRSSAP